MLQQGLQQTHAVAEPPKEGALADTCRGGHRFHGEVLQPVLPHYRCRGVEQAGVIAYRVRAQPSAVLARTR
ncbi:hypothetical protein [Streptomyces griseoaurantiacus]|jgi:hypothetical protein|uniref:hypothetical protein n=1 Tax=Streptomyces griseoaurantiacus TaxID=68213 RepID=UPI0036AD74F6